MTNIRSEPTKPIIPNQTCRTKPTKLNLPNKIYQREFIFIKYNKEVGTTRSSR